MESANKRIAYNTLFMYIRLFSVTVIGLYTSRLALEILGISDYGLFSVVGGVLALFTFISGSLTNATSRFINTEMGRIDGDVNASFNINLVLHVCFAVIIFILTETIGLWYIYNKLNVAEGKLDDAVFVYHITIFTTCLGIINSPYQSLFNAHERFKFMAILDIVNSLIRLGGILMLTLVRVDSISFSFLLPLPLLRLYALIMVLTTANTFIVFHWVAYRNWPNIIKRRIVKGWNKYKDVLSFGGWNLLAAMSVMARSSGSDLVLNSFFGTSVNGAYAISKYISQYLSEFSSKFNGASAPQIIQAYAAGNTERYTYLANKLGRINLLLFEIICFPVLIELNLVLYIWLGTVPKYAFEFSLVNILVGGMSLTSGGILNVIHASGKIKWFNINLSFFFLACIPIGALLFYFGCPPYYILLLFFMADFIQRIIELTLAKRILHYDSWSYVREAYSKPVIIAIIMTVVLYVHSLLAIDSIYFRLTSIVVCFFVVAMLVYTIGLSAGEKLVLRSKLHLS